MSTAEAAVTRGRRGKRTVSSCDQLSRAELKRKKTKDERGSTGTSERGDGDVVTSERGDGDVVPSERGDGDVVTSERGAGDVVPSERVRCGLDFFHRPCVELARAMLGCVLVCCGESGEECRGEVVEVEAYLGGEDRAAHSYNGRRTKANEAMYMEPGTAYVYSIYGVHHCFNVSSQGGGAAVLVRALRPTAGLETMWRRRGLRERRRDTELCSGPGKLCQAMGITKQYDQVDMVTSQSLWLERGRPLIPDLVRETPRVGIDSAGERWAGALLRFHLGDCRYVSKARRRNDISS